MQPTAAPSRYWRAVDAKGRKPVYLQRHLQQGESMREVQTECDDPVSEILQAVIRAAGALATPIDLSRFLDHISQELPEFFSNRLQIADEVFEYEPDQTKE
jgi:hypothetical protein